MVLVMDALGLTDAERVAVGDAVGAAGRVRVGGGEDGVVGGLPVVPAQLPAGVAGFAGRVGELARLDEVLAAAGGGRSGVAVGVVVGMAGVGKTALVVQWAHRVADRFPDGQLYVDLRGFDPGGAMRPGEALRGFLSAFGVAPRRMPADEAGRAALYRSVLASRRVLVVLDNARDAEQVRPLLPGSPQCAVVVTSRDALTGLVSAVGAGCLTLNLPSVEEATQLLANRLGGQRVAAEPQAVARIVTRCARLPLALSVVAARAAAHPGFPLAAVADELRDAHNDLGVFGGGDPTTDVRAVFSWSYRTVGADAARLFRLLASHPGPDIGIPAVASLAGVPAGQARWLLAELCRAQLVTEQAAGRYGFHELLRVFAAELGRAVDSVEDRRAAQHRLLDHYLHTAHRAAVLLYPHRDPLTLTAPRPGVIPEDLADRASALAWLTGHQPVLVAAVEQAHHTGLAAHAWQLAWALAEHQCRTGRWDELAACQRTALAAALREADPARQADAHRQLGRVCTCLGEYPHAYAHLEQALRRFGALHDHTGKAHTHLDLAVLLAHLGCPEEALRHAEQALELYRATDHRSGRAHALNCVGWVHTLLGNPERGLGYCTEALALHCELGDRRGVADTLDSLGHAHHHRQDYLQARARYEQAAAIYRELGDRRSQADTLTRLGDTHQAAADTAAAEHARLEAHTILDQLDHHRQLPVQAGGQMALTSSVNATARRRPTGSSAPIS
jgi:tetratricopeptide (TPR) repeat protein